jgi:uncharacterized membrane protein YjfL (UPF0719 family)
MDSDYQITPFSRALLTGVFVGFVTTIICLVFNIIYRDSTGFTPAEIINVSSIIFGINLIFVVIGMVYHVFLKFIRKGEVFFIAVFALITAFLIWKAEGAIRSDNYQVTLQFRGLLAGIIIISGIGASVLIPFLFHDKRFKEHVL